MFGWRSGFRVRRPDANTLPVFEYSAPSEYSVRLESQTNATENPAEFGDLGVSANIHPGDSSARQCRAPTSYVGVSVPCSSAAWPFMCSSLPGYFYSQLQEASIPVKPLPASPDAIGAQSASEIDELAERCEGLEQRLVSLHDSYETLKRRELELKEWRWVLREAGGFFDRVCQAHMRRAFFPGSP